jgi:hypothetical protein
MDEFPAVLDKVSYELTTQRNQLRLSLESRVDNPMVTIENFSSKFQLSKEEREAIQWAWPLEAGETMFNVIIAYTRAAQFEGLAAESSYKLQRIGGTILSMVN